MIINVRNNGSFLSRTVTLFAYQFVSVMFENMQVKKNLIFMNFEWYLYIQYILYINIYVNVYFELNTVPVY